MKKFCSILLSIIFAVCLLFTLLLSVVRFNFSYSTITNIASQMLKPVSAAPRNNDGLFHPEDKVLSLAQYDFNAADLEGLDLSSIDFTNLDVNEIVQTYLDASGIEVEPEFIAEVLASPEVSDFVDKYATEVVEYMTGAKTELEINADDIVKVMNKSIDMYEEHTGEVVDRTGLNEAVESNVAVMQTELTTALDTAKEENAETFEYLKKVNTLLSIKTYLLCICICVVLAVIIFLINMNVFVMFKYISIPAIVDGVLIFIVAVISAAVLPSALSMALSSAGNIPGGIYEAILAYATSVLFQMKIYGIVTTLLGVVLCVLGFKLGKTKAAA